MDDMVLKLDSNILLRLASDAESLVRHLETSPTLIVAQSFALQTASREHGCFALFLGGIAMSSKSTLKKALAYRTVECTLQNPNRECGINQGFRTKDTILDVITGILLVMDEILEVVKIKKRLLIENTGFAAQIGDDVPEPFDAGCVDIVDIQRDSLKVYVAEQICSCARASDSGASCGGGTVPPAALGGTRTLATGTRTILRPRAGGHLLDLSEGVWVGSTTQPEGGSRSKPMYPRILWKLQEMAGKTEEQGRDEETQRRR